MRTHTQIICLAAAVIGLQGCAGLSGPATSNAPSLAFSAPAAGETKAAAIPVITLFFNEALDPASVDASAIELKLDPTRIIDIAEREYDAQANVLTLRLAMPLPLSTNVALNVSGLKSEKGQSVSTINLSFTTDDTYRYRGIEFQDGRISGYFEEWRDSREGEEVSYNVNYINSGSDQVWFTGDDEISRYVRTRSTAEGTLEATFVAPGADGVWLTDDDVPESYTRLRSSDTLYQSAQYQGPGPDGVWFTDDDASDNCALQSSEGDEEQSVTVYKRSRQGADNQCFTADDVILEVNRDEQKSQGDKVRAASWVYSHPGADGVWETADDQVSAFSVSDYDDETSAVANYASPGKDGAWLTQDDRLSDYSITTTKEGLTRTVFYRDPGYDGLWRTADDIPFGYSEERSDADGHNIFSKEVNNPGPDGVWFTQDDLLASHAKSETDENGNFSRWINYSSTGPDREPFTDDDLVNEYYTSSISADRESIEEAGFRAPGADGVWFTEDDTPTTLSRRWERQDEETQRSLSATYNTQTAATVGQISDDAITYYSVSESQAGYYMDASYQSPGPDGLWLTADDTPATMTLNYSDPQE
ncbi:Ig-like domain-containing protein [Hahella sp. HN01]|uniref:Ig-like domain-containing protein n=1 Tax=Hahella sp. HN01 TaxID=2847262 RepID=UPI001C1EA54A|nr:Ig-like domain-containing protein [Hahella sp. HN01]MBU6953894.1 Ig-like domain-containing protein [Hahella sp. HN01]